jgi:hypothetical protein
MNINAPSVRRLRASVFAPRRRSSLERRVVKLSDGARTTLHVAAYHRTEFVPRVAVVEPPTELVRWCRRQAVGDAIVGGFFVRPGYVPLGELHVGGEAWPSVPFDAPWAGFRGCVEIVGGQLRIARRDQLGSSSAGDRLQAGPVLVLDGRRVAGEADDPEGFSAGARQFDSDITRGRYPRAALAVAGEELLAVVCDGRARRDAGMTLTELADTLVELGATEALNLDGGGSASLVYEGKLRNRPREQHGADLLEGRPVVTAIAFEPTPA